MIIELFLSAIFLSPALAADSAKPVVEHSPAAVSAANRRFGARCAREPLAVDELLSDAAFRADLGTRSAEEEERALVEYSACRSLQGAPAGCGALDGLGHPFALSAADCRGRAAEDLFVFRALRGGDAQAACRRFFEVAGRKRGPSVEKGCAAVIEAVRGGNASASCAALAREKLIPLGDSCPDMMVLWSGDPKACDRIKDVNIRFACRGRSSLVAALRDPAKCPASPSCQVLVARSIRACEPLRAIFSRALCARVAKDLATEKDVAARELREQERLREAAQQRARKLAEAAAAVKAKAAQQAEAAVAAIAKEKATVAADLEKVAKRAAVQAAKAASAEAAVRAKADAYARKAAAAKAKIAKQEKAQFKKGEPMQKIPVEAAEAMKAIEEGRPIPKPKPAPKKKAAKKAVPSEP